MPYLFRVDDFPHRLVNCEEFIKFQDIMETYRISYALGINPMISLNSTRHDSEIRAPSKEERSVIKSLKNISFAYHGTTHRTLRSSYHSEFVGLSEKETMETVKKGLTMMKKLGIRKSETIIPSFNTFDLVNVQAFKKFFKIVTGGPETIGIFGRLPPGNLDGIFYLPSYKPFYGYVKYIIKAVEKNELSKNKEIKCITVHWAWDVENNFSDTVKLAKLLEGKVLEWKEKKILNLQPTGSFWTG